MPSEARISSDVICMVTKPEAKKAIRSLATDWFREIEPTDREHPNFSAFKRWLRERGYEGYLDFRSTEGADEAAEAWFDQELGQTWRR